MARLRAFCGRVRNPKTTPNPSRMVSSKPGALRQISIWGRGSTLFENYSLPTRRVFPLDRLRPKCVANN